MSVSLLCPNCSAATTFHRPPVTACPACQAPFPDSLRGPAEASLAREKAPRPLLLTLGIYGSAFFAGVSALFLILAPFNIGSYSIGDRAVTGPEFLRQVGATFGVAGALCAAISYGLWRERSWTRPLMLLFWVVLDITLITQAVKYPAPDLGPVGATFFSAVYVLVSAWYLYGRASVNAYYAALRAAERTSAPRTPHGA